MESLFLVNLHILKGVDDVESSHPEQDHCGQEPDPRRFKRRRVDGNGGCYRAQGKTRAEPEMAELSEALGDSIEGNPAKDRQTEHAGPPVVIENSKQATAHHEREGRHGPGGSCLANSQLT